MGYDIDDQSHQFEECELDVFGETIEYSANGAAFRHVDAVVYRTLNEPAGLPKSGTSRTKIEIKISQRDTAGIGEITMGKDKVRLMVLPSDDYERTLTVTSVNAEYGAWRLGLL